MYEDILSNFDTHCLVEIEMDRISYSPMVHAFIEKSPFF